MKFNTILHGIYGIAMVELASFLNPLTITDLTKAIIQVVIAIITLYQLLKKKKST
jgi:hypothetical protein